ncbi:MAG: pyridoxamine kinase [Lachnospiraceae bacterium]|jgi:pyridoxine kinase
MTQIHQKKIMMINDLSGYGRCSLTVAIPILAALKIQCCPVPTSIFSNHTGFPTWHFDDYTEHMPEYLGKWKELNLSFDGIAVGFLGSARQMEIVEQAILTFQKPHTSILIDPIMGDHGKAYATYTDEMCRKMGRLIGLADIITPNLTEACILTGIPYRSSGWKRSELEAMARILQSMGPKQVVITGAKEGSYLTNTVALSDGTIHFIRTRTAGEERPGTGDVFSSIVAGGMVMGEELAISVKKAARFIGECIKISDKLEIPRENGVCFEMILGKLAKSSQVQSRKI